jgi:hypothetical protein
MTDELRAEIEAERARQDAQWGGPAHDDEHSLWDWFGYIKRQVTLAGFGAEWAHLRGKSITSSMQRERLIKIAGLAVAAIESLDRKEKK